MKILSFATLLSKQTSKFIARHEKDELFVLSPLEDAELFARMSQTKFLKYEIDTLGYVLALVCARLLDDFIQIDDGYLSGESNAGDEEIDELCEFVRECDGVIVAPENFTGTNSQAICYMLDKLSKKFNFCIIGIDGKPATLEVPNELGELSDGADFNGASVFCLPAQNIELKGSAMFGAAAKLKNGAKLDINTPKGQLSLTFELDPALKGTCALLFAPELEYGFLKL